ncbi:hypothetical protein LshimejAT787_0310670 [Lyophyllum shimeji]|uniref:Uncharacterized protein n=1 Tax=Lyophyllum shimeji TaxID=47721 RepID=A0A9P3PIF9_LYOSH|nr:hypothetical protein LshimejAT787_0310670 [Lyophyllum shimeji]
MSELSSSDAVTLTPQVSDPPPPPPIPSAISAAIAKFRPTPKEVIRGIAPHVFDERRRRRRRSHSPRPTGHYTTQHKRDGAGAGAKSSSSPLRFSAVMTVDSEGSLIFLDQTVTEHRHHHSQYQHQAEVKATRDLRPSQDCSAPARDPNPQPIIEISGKIDKSRPRGFRIVSIRIFKSIAGKLKPALSQVKPLCSPSALLASMLCLSSASGSCLQYVIIDWNIGTQAPSALSNAARHSRSNNRT